MSLTMMQSVAFPTLSLAHRQSSSACSKNPNPLVLSSSSSAAVLTSLKYLWKSLISPNGIQDIQENAVSPSKFFQPVVRARSYSAYATSIATLAVSSRRPRYTSFKSGDRVANRFRAYVGLAVFTRISWSISSTSSISVSWKRALLASLASLEAQVEGRGDSVFPSETAVFRSGEGVRWVLALRLPALSRLERCLMGLC
jgi:hypothetical protein